ncbi:MAG TPA: DNA repair protein RecO [Candidatus Acidoferrales bacterium]|nr:DNA repair protein RecO [Candidatus Acidoferrales bacterium]
MPIHESEAIILHGYPLGEADRLISFLSRTMGRVRGVAPGARRPKSRFGSTLELMSYVRIWFFERETRDLTRINQCELIESFVSAFKDYDASIALTLMAEITESVLPDREPSDPAFRLLLLSAQNVKRRGQVALALAYFALWTVRLAGWLGSFELCTRCGRELAGAAAYTSPAVSGILCANCRTAGMKAISPTAMAAARSMLGERLDAIKSDAFSKPVLRELANYLLDMIEYQAERKLISREMWESNS